jgi:hypothetical protein
MGAQGFQTVTLPSNEKPTGAFVLSLIAGIFILLGGGALISVGNYISSISFGVQGGELVLLGAVGAVMGILVILFGILLYVTPQNHVIYGVLVLVLSIGSLFTALGGLFLGLILGIIAGALGIAWKPSQTVVMAPAVPPPMSMGRACSKCGWMAAPGTQFCSRCGNPIT